MEWPQITMIVIYAISIMASAILDGQPKTGKNSFPLTVVGTCIGVWILYMGGFWS